MYYIRIEEDNSFSLMQGSDINSNTDHVISDSSYEELVKEISGDGSVIPLKPGKEFKVKDLLGTGDVYTDYLEEYTPAPLPPAPQSELELLQEEVLNQSEMILDMDFRLTSVELGL